MIAAPVGVIRRIEKGQIVTYPVDSQGRIIPTLQPSYSLIPPSGTKNPPEQFTPAPQ